MSSPRRADRASSRSTAGAKIAAADKDPAAAQAREATIVAAWRKWYGEAVRSVSRLVVGPASSSLGDEDREPGGVFRARRDG